MNDSEMARIGRELADTLHRFARERDDASKKQISALHVELCVARRAELETPEKEGN